MKTLLSCWTAVAAALLLAAGCQRQSGSVETINPVLGDISYVQEFGIAPGSMADEQVRVATHLRYVEELLRRKSTRTLPSYLRRRRYQAIKLLHQYRMAGQFPVNDVAAGRRPCFIDRTGRVSAVGYLVEQTAGRPVVEKINQQHQYDYIRDMRTPELLAWVKASGLTLEECAMIQPTHGTTSNHATVASGESELLQ